MYYMANHVFKDGIHRRLAQDYSSRACERSWSAFYLIQEQGHNRLCSNYYWNDWGIVTPICAYRKPLEKSLKIQEMLM